MWNKRKIQISCCGALLLAMGFSACKSTKTLQPTSPTDAVVQHIQPQPQEIRSMQVQCTVSVMGMSFRTVLWAQVDSAVCVSLQPFLGIEMARLYADKNEVAAVNRLSRKYTQMRYQELNLGYPIHYAMLQGLLCNKVFSLGDAAAPFDKDSQGDVVLWSQKTDSLQVLFTMDSAGQLVNTILTAPGQADYVMAEYSNFDTMAEGFRFPRLMNFMWISPKNTYTIRVDVTKVELNKEVMLNPGLSAGFSKVSLEEFKQSILK